MRAAELKIELEERFYNTLPLTGEFPLLDAVFNKCCLDIVKGNNTHDFDNPSYDLSLLAYSYWQELYLINEEAKDYFFKNNVDSMTYPYDGNDYIINKSDPIIWAIE